jgi:hypothetical protein
MIEYDAIFNEIAEQAFESRLHGGSSLYQIGRIPNIENLDYDSVIRELDEITRVLRSEYEGEFYEADWGGDFDDEN